MPSPMPDSKHILASSLINAETVSGCIGDLLSKLSEDFNAEIITIVKLNYLCSEVNLIKIKMSIQFINPVIAIYK